MVPADSVLGGFPQGPGGGVEGDAQADLDVPAGDVHVVDQQP